MQDFNWRKSSVELFFVGLNITGAFKKKNLMTFKIDGVKERKRRKFKHH